MHQWLKYYLNDELNNSTKSKNTNTVIKLVAWFFESYDDTPTCLSVATDVMRLFLVNDTRKKSLMIEVISNFIKYFKSDSNISNTHHDILLYINKYNLDFSATSIRGFLASKRHSNFISILTPFCMPIIHFLMTSSQSELIKERMQSIYSTIASTASTIKDAAASSANSITRNAKTFFGRLLGKEAVVIQARNGATIHENFVKRSSRHRNLPPWVQNLVRPRLRLKTWC